MTPKLAAILTLVLTIAPAAAVAQTTAPSVPRAEKKWSLVRGHLDGRNDIAPAMEDAMRAAGFDDDAVTYFGRLSHPYSSRNTIGSETDLTYRHSRRLAFGLRKTSVGLGSTSGFHAFYGSLQLKSEVTAFAPIAYFRVSRHLRVGAGPVAASTKIGYPPSLEMPEGTQLFKSTVYGGLVTASLETGFLRYFVIGVNASRTWMPSVAAGPFTTDNGDEFKKVYGTGTVPSMRVNMSHHTVGLSLGLRF